MARSLRRALLAALALVAALLAAPATAHLTPNSEIGLAIGRSHVEAILTIPLGELQYAEPGFAGLAAGPLGGPIRQKLARYLARHVAATSAGGQAWSVELANAAVEGDGSPDVMAVLALRPPAGISPRRFALRYDAVMDRVPNHFALVYLRHDFDGGKLSDDRRLLGGLRRGSPSLAVNLGASSTWDGFAAAVRLGEHHIAEGHDHLLFLFALLLAAPLHAAGRRWTGYAGWRHTARSLLAVVTAFTIGHSLTLIGGAFLDWRLPAQPVEVLIALSILISAIHAWRPIFAGREAMVAAGFGLVHGLAFATLVGQIGLDRWQQALAILGFNIGIELVQLLVVAMVTPGLVLLARTRVYPTAKDAAAAFAGVAALCWIIERISGRDFAPARIIDTLLGYAPWALVAAAAVSAGALVARRLTSSSRTC